MTYREDTRGAGTHIVTEAEAHRSREAIVCGQIEPTLLLPDLGKLLAGTVLAQAVLDFTAPPVVDDAGNTGDGTLTLAVGNEVGSKVEAGDYVVTCVNTTDVVFSVLTPSGAEIGDAIDGVAFVSDHLNFTIAAGATPFVVGDKFTVTVLELDAADQLFYPIDLAEVNGLQNSIGVLFGPVNVQEGSADAAATVRAAEVLGSELVYPDGATEDDKAAINAQLVGLGIIVR